MLVLADSDSLYQRPAQFRHKRPHPPSGDELTSTKRRLPCPAPAQA